MAYSLPAAQHEGGLHGKAGIITHPPSACRWGAAAGVVRALHDFLARIAPHFVRFFLLLFSFLRVSPFLSFFLFLLWL